MKVCMISTHHGLFDDRIYWKEALALKNAGYEVCHLTLGTEEKKTISPEGIFLQLIQKKTYFKNPYLDKFYRMFFFKPSVYTGILSEVAKIKADVYHIHDFQLLRIGKQLKRLSHRPKLIYDVHEPFPVTIAHSYTPNIVSKLINKVYAVYIRYWEMRKAGYADYIIATEENVCNKFRKVYGKEKAGIIYNYCDMKVLPDMGKIKKEYDLVYTGNIRKNRGAFTIVEVTAMLKKKIPGIRTLLIGTIQDAKIERKIKELIQKLDVNKEVDIKPFIPYEKMSEIYARSKAGLILFDDNPIYRIIMPIKLFEYMTFGLPVVSSNVGHPGRIVQKYDAGITVDPKNKKEIADKIIGLLENKELYNRLSKNAKDAAAKNFRWGLMGKRLTEMYTYIMNR